MAAISAQKVIPRVRKRLGLSQEGLSRMLNATKGAVQHWERGRNNPDLGRLLALRQITPAGPERRDLDRLIRETQSQISPMPTGRLAPVPGPAILGRGMPAGPINVAGSLDSLRKQNQRLSRQVERLESTLHRRDEELRILTQMMNELKDQVSSLRTK